MLRQPAPWLHLDGALEATSFYETKHLKSTLERLVDFDRINAGVMRFSVGAVNVRTGNFVYFDNETHAIRPEHVIASGSLPPGFPAVEIEGEFYWDGGLISNTPLQWVVEQGPRRDTLAFQVDLWSARGELPGNLADVMMRQKEIQYSSRTRANTDQFKQYQRARKTLASLLSKLPDDLLASEEATMLSSIADHKVYLETLRGPLEGFRVFPDVHGGALARRLSRRGAQFAPSRGTAAAPQSRRGLYVRPCRGRTGITTSNLARDAPHRWSMSSNQLNRVSRSINKRSFQLCTKTPSGPGRSPCP
jgi:predicted acylesterase/phospholipase RssA